MVQKVISDTNLIQGATSLYSLDPSSYATLFHIFDETSHSYSITPVKSAAPLSRSIKDFSLLWKTKSSCALFVGLISKYKTDTFRRRLKLHIDLKKQNYDKN